MTTELAGISTEAVFKATGKSWDEWIELLDKLGVRRLSHKDTACLLRNDGYIKSDWWSQMVTVGYEYFHGKRVLGQTSSAGFEIGVQKTLALPEKHAWNLMIGPKGRDVWLGKSKDFVLERGASYSTDQGITGEIRTFIEGKFIRLTWKPHDWDRLSTLQMYLIPQRDKTSIRFHQEKLSHQTDRNVMKQHWQNVLLELEKLI